MPDSRETSMTCTGRTIARSDLPPAPSPRSPGSQHAVHPHRIDQAEPRMVERLRQPSDDLKSKALPQRDRARIAADDEIELHGAETPRSRMRERVGAHGPRHAPPARRVRRHIPAIGDMRAAALLI